MSEDKKLDEQNGETSKTPGKEVKYVQEMSNEAYLQSIEAAVSIARKTLDMFKDNDHPKIAIVTEPFSPKERERGLELLQIMHKSYWFDFDCLTSFSVPPDEAIANLTETKYDLIIIVAKNASKELLKQAEQRLRIPVFNLA